MEILKKGQNKETLRHNFRKLLINVKICLPGQVIHSLLTFEVL